MKNERRPEASAPPPRAVQPRPGGAALAAQPRLRAGAHFSTFNETFEAALADGRARRPMGGGSGRRGVPPLDGWRPAQGPSAGTQGREAPACERWAWRARSPDPQRRWVLSFCRLKEPSVPQGAALSSPPTRGVL